MKKLIVWTLILCLSVSPALAQSRGSFTYGAAYNTAEEARRRALECLSVCGFYGYNDGERVDRGVLVRWADRIYAQVQGSPTSEDLDELKGFFMELGLRVPEMPQIFMTDDADQANLTIYYMAQRQLPDAIPSYPENYKGWCQVHWEEAYQIDKGVIGIATDVNNQRQRNYLMRRSLLGALGLLDYHALYEDSILYNDWTELQTLSEVDWLMLNILYSPSIQSGMNYDQVYQVVEERYFFQ